MLPTVTAESPDVVPVMIVVPLEDRALIEVDPVTVGVFVPVLAITASIDCPPIA